MKKLILSLSLLTYIFLGCTKKKDDPTPATTTPVNKSKTELLTQHSWKLLSSTADKDVDYNEDGTASTNIMAQRKACENDDIITFTNSSGSNKTGSKDQGPTKCNTTDEQNVTFNWSWNDSETVIKTKAFWIFTEEYTVLELNNEILKVTYGAEDKNNMKYIVTDVYVKP